LKEGRDPDEDDLIDHILQNQLSNPIPIGELMKEYRINPWDDLCPIDLIAYHVNIIQFGASKTLEINHFVPAK